MIEHGIITFFLLSYFNEINTIGMHIGIEIKIEERNLFAIRNSNQKRCRTLTLVLRNLFITLNLHPLIIAVCKGLNTCSMGYNSLTFH